MPEEDTKQVTLTAPTVGAGFTSNSFDVFQNVAGGELDPPISASPTINGTWTNAYTTAGGSTIASGSGATFSGSASLICFVHPKATKVAVRFSGDGSFCGGIRDFYDDI